MSRVTMVQSNASLNQNKTSVRKLALFLASIALAMSVSARTEDKDIVDKLILDPTLKTFTNLVTKAGLLEVLKEEGPYTIFAPNDAAFAKMHPTQLAAIRKDRATLVKFIQYSVVNGQIETKDLKEGNLKSLSGEPIAIGIKTGPKFNAAKFVAKDQKCANGVLHTVDTVSIPPSLLKSLKVP